MMDTTLGYLLCCQSPALFLLAASLLVAYLTGREHKVRAFFRLLLCILCAAGGVALYFLGMYKEYFTIRDFFHIRTPGWVGLAVVVFFLLLTLVRAFFAAADARREQKAAARAENQRLHEAAQEAAAQEAAQQFAQEAAAQEAAQQFTQEAAAQESARQFTQEASAQEAAQEAAAQSCPAPSPAPTMLEPDYPPAPAAVPDVPPSGEDTTPPVDLVDNNV